MEDPERERLTKKQTLANVKADTDAVYSKISWKLLPTLFLMTAVCYVDRNNISLAAINMSKDLDISKTQYGTAASLFFVTYMIFQIPSNMMLSKVGGPIWLGAILIGWGLVASLTSFVHDAYQLYLMRLLLGIFEAGAFPGIWYYISTFFSDERIPFAISIVNSGMIAGLCVSAPAAGVLLSMHSTLGFSGWQWLLFIEGIPSILLGCFVMFYLPKSPNSENFLSANEQKILEADKCVNLKVTADVKSLVHDIVLNASLWAYLAGWILRGVAKYAAQFWTPVWIDSLATSKATSEVKGTPADNGENHTGEFVAFLTAVPFSFAAVATVLVGWSSSRFRERKYHIVLLSIFGGVVFCFLPEASGRGSLTVILVALTLVHCALAVDGPVLGLCMASMKNESKSFGLAWCNTVGNVSGIVGPYMVGVLVDQTGSHEASLYFSGAMLLVSVIFYLVVRDHTQDKNIHIQ